MMSVTPEQLLCVCYVGEKDPSGEAFDVFMGPLVQDLLKLWAGVSAVDMSLATKPRLFRLRGICL